MSISSSSSSSQEHIDRMVDPRVLDPNEELVHYSSLSGEEMDQITRVLVDMRRWRTTEQQINLRLRSAMSLNDTDMKALHFLAIAKNDGRLVTPTMLSEHLGISSASMTKLLDRLESVGHIARAQHPRDRRALVITITGATHEEVRDTVGRTHARRFDVVAALSPDEREVVARFLEALIASADEPAESSGR